MAGVKLCDFWVQVQLAGVVLPGTQPHAVRKLTLAHGRATERDSGSQPTVGTDRLKDISAGKSQPLDSAFPAKTQYHGIETDLLP